VSNHYETDQNLARAAKEFNLTRIARKRRDDGVGIWDGTEILFTVSFSVVLIIIFTQEFLAGRRPAPYLGQAQVILGIRVLVAER
jgi:hypothetical protein